jgi:hypothetical protein
MYRLYKEYDGLAVRTARAYKQLEKAIQVALKIQAAFVEVRRLLPNGKEVLVDIIVDGRTLA